MKKIPVEPSLKLALDLLKTDIFSSFNCHAVGNIESFDVADQTAKISIAYSRSTIDDVEKLKEYPVLIDCPVIVLTGGKGSLTLPIAKGDQCLVLFNDRDIDSWFAGGATALLNTTRKHSFSDGIALVGLHSLNKSISNYSSDRVELGYDQTKISIKDKVKIVNSFASLYTILDGVLGVLAGFTSTNCAVGYPVMLSPAQVIQVNNFKAQLGQLME